MREFGVCGGFWGRERKRRRKRGRGCHVMVVKIFLKNIYIVFNLERSRKPWNLVAHVQREPRTGGCLSQPTTPPLLFKN